MSYYRSYFSKNNTIIQDSLVNTAKNPNTELFYGSSFSKYIFNINLDDLKSKINNGDFVLDSNTKHYLRITNTIFGDEAYKGQKSNTGKERTSSFDLIVFPIEEEWDEGVGFDYEKTYDYTTGNETYNTKPSNWFYRTTLDVWSVDGIYSLNPSSIISTIHFDNGDENIDVDITSYVNDILSGATNNYGLGIAFHPDYSLVTSDIDQSVAFFTKYTQTFHEPYLETVFNDIIEDDRENFITGESNNLYLYVTKGTNFYDLDNNPIVEILTSPTATSSLYGLDNLTTIKIRKGVYKLSLGISGAICDGKKFLYDKWKNLSINGVSIDSVVQKFVPKPLSGDYSIGENPIDLERYSIQFFGVKLNEKIKRGENRKIVVSFKSINNPSNRLFEEVYYRIYIKEGKTQVNVFDWTKLDRTNENSFILNTSYLIPREYWIEIKAKTYNEEIFYNNEIKFEIVSEI